MFSNLYSIQTSLILIIRHYTDYSTFTIHLLQDIIYKMKNINLFFKPMIRIRI